MTFFKKKSARLKSQRSIALVLLFILLNQMFAPVVAYALTAGPTAPEATNFEPVDTTDMVNPLTGDFTYNIPLLEVPGPEGGYPLSLSYHAAIQPNEDASWVGLGWSLNPGAIARNVNGFPDDWNGDNTLTMHRVWPGGVTNIKSYNIGVNLPITGDYVSVNFGLSFAQDTYRGFGLGYSVGGGVGLGQDTPVGIYGNIGVEPYGGLYAGAGLNASFNIAQSGLSGSASIGVSTNFKNVNVNGGGSISTVGASLGASISTSQSPKYSASLGMGSVNAVNNANEGKIQSVTEDWSESVSLFFVTLGVNYQQQFYWSNVTDNSSGFGVLYNHSSIGNVSDFNAVDDDNYNLIDVNNNNIVDNPNVDSQVGGTFPNFDDYSVTAQGLGGYMRPYAFSTVLYKQNTINSTDHSNDVVAETRGTTGVTRTNWQFRFMNDFSNSYRQGSPWSDTNYDFDSAPQYGNSDGAYGYDATTNRLEGSKHIEYFTNDEINDLRPTSKAHQMGFITCDAGGFTRPSGGQIGGFMVTNASGVTYHYALPVYNTGEGILTEKVGSNGSNNYNNLIKAGRYAYTWYLTAITGPDYVSRGATLGQIDKNDWGYWVKFDYGKWTDNYNWRNPAQGFLINVDNNFESVSTGLKELYYLDAIETRSHTAIFEKEIRADGKSLNPGDLISLGPNEESGYNLSPGQLCINTKPHDGCVFAPDYPVPTLRLKDILLFQNDQLSISVANLRKNNQTYNGQYDYAASKANDDGTVPQVHRNVFYGDNVIDTFDISNTSPGIVNNCLRKIVMNYDYSLCPGTVNSSNISYPTTVSDPYVNTPINFSYVPPPILGKLTLLSVDFQGRGGVPMTPPVQFGYDLDATDPSTQTTISISQPTGLNGTITQSGNNISVGDILTFTSNSKQYYCTLLSTQDNLSFNVLYLNAAPSASGSGISAVRTKNPPYNKDAYDNWGCYKSDYLPLVPNNENLARMTSSVSSKSTDVWSLRKIISSTGANININYEGDTYSRSVLNKSKSIIASSGTYDATAKTVIMNVLNPTNLDLTQLYTIGAKIDGVLLFKQSTGSKLYIVAPISSYPNCTIQSVTGNNVKIAVDPGLVGALSNSPVFVTGNITGNNKINYGGGLRVKNLIVDDLNGHVNKSTYDYTIPGPVGQATSSGVTTYEPAIFDSDQVPAGTDINGQDVIKVYRKALYSASSKLLQISHVIPAPGIAYEYVNVSQSTALPSGQAVPIEGKTMYQYEVFKPEMLGVLSYSYASTTVNANKTVNGNASTFIVNQLKQNLAIKDYTSRIGNLKRMVTYDNAGNKLTEKINHYLYDDLENTSLANQINKYEPRLSGYNGVAYNYQGVIQERYGNARLVTVGVDNNKNSNKYNDLLVMSNKETFPAIQTGTTQIDYKNGTQIDQSNLGYDYYTGAVTKALITDSYGNRFLSQATPAYMAGNGTVYPALGLKTHDDIPNAVQHKQMLTQQASNYTFSVDNSNTPIGVVSASAQTWSNATPVLDPDGNVTTTGQSNIWRMEKSIVWMPAGTAANNVTPYASFADYFASVPNSNASWKTTSQITQYNVYSAALEARDINTNYAATRMGYNSSKVLVTGSPARYNEIAYAGAEDALLTNGNFSNSISKGGGVVVTDAVNSHTGTNALSVAAGSNGFTYQVAVGSLNTQRSYSVAVWVKPTASNVNLASLYYQVNNGTVVTPAQSYAKTAAGWYLLEMTVPSSALTGGNLIVGCKNGSTATLYFDDFRFQPASAAATAYVYDKQTGELSYILNNNNLYTRYQYDAIGRLVQTSKEVLGKTNIPVVNTVKYHYQRNGNVN